MGSAASSGERHETPLGTTCASGGDPVGGAIPSGHDGFLVRHVPGACGPPLSERLINSTQIQKLQMPCKSFKGLTVGQCREDYPIAVRPSHDRRAHADGGALALVTPMLSHGVVVIIDPLSKDNACACARRQPRAPRDVQPSRHRAAPTFLRPRWRRPLAELHIPAVRSRGWFLHTYRPRLPGQQPLAQASYGGRPLYPWAQLSQGEIALAQEEGGCYYYRVAYRGGAHRDGGQGTLSRVRPGQARTARDPACHGEWRGV